MPSSTSKKYSLKEKKPKSKISNGVKIGLIAIFINMITVFVYIYQTSLMQEQQHASVWPYIEWKMIYNQEEGMILRVSNNGIGPALITNTTIKLNGIEQPNLDSLFIGLIGTTKFPHLTGNLNKRVLPAGSSFTIFKSSDSKWSELIYAAYLKNDFEMIICYESIYKDKWVSNGVDVVESECE